MTNEKKAPSIENKSSRALPVALLGLGIAALSFLGYKAVEDFSRNEAPATTTTTVVEAPTTSTVPTTETTVGGVVVTPENPVNSPANEQTVPEATVESEDGPTSVIVTPENPIETETPVSNG